MRRLKFAISLLMKESPYQRLLAADVEEAAHRLDVDVRIVYAVNDAVTQSIQLLDAIQSRSSNDRPDGVLCYPVGTTMEKVAHQAAAKGIAWVLLNRTDDYIAELRKTANVPVFSVSVDQEEVGRIQGQQFGALLPEGGLVLYIRGPNISISEQRLSGMQSSRPSNITLRMFSGDWTESSGYKAAGAWLRLSIAETTPARLVAAQNDAMAVGARRAFQETANPGDHGVPFFSGVDCCPGAGEEWLRKRLLTASVVQPPVTGVALTMLVQAVQARSQPAEHTLITPASRPEIEQLRPGSDGH